MKSKLLLSSALVGSLAVTGIASAQTTITGSLDLSYKTISNKGTITKQTDAGFGRESQINFANKGKLSNGMNYAAGFSLEYDGLSGANVPDTTTNLQANIQRISRENIYMDLILGNTTLSVGADHLNNMSFSSAPRVSVNAATAVASAQLVTSSGAAVAAGTTSGGVAYNFYPGGAAMGSSNFMGVGVQQATPFGTVTGQFFPRANAQQAGNDGVARVDTADAYELHFRGDLGVKGLSFNAGYNVLTTTNPSATQGKNQKGKAIGIGYNFGQVAVGLQRNTIDNRTTSGTGTKIDTKSMEYGVTYAVTKDFSIGATVVKTDGTFRSTAPMTADEDIRAVTVGYNLGAISVSATYASLENARGVNQNDSDIVLVRANTRF